MSDSPLSQLVRLFAPASSTAAEADLTRRLALVLADPAAYATTYAEELLERGVDYTLPDQELRDIALLDALLAHDLLWEADWKETADSMADGLNLILTQRHHPARLDVAALAARSLTGPEALDTLQEALEPLGLALVLPALDSDSYPLTLVADTQAADTRRLARELGFRLSVY